MGLNLHTRYDRLYKNQALWDAPEGGGSFRDGLPYWSKVEKLTIHLKTVTDPASAGGGDGRRARRARGGSGGGRARGRGAQLAVVVVVVAGVLART